ncbi:Arginine metabolism regulation protein II [Colletotrichum siamense]|nr:Arginine metabolism regulation protein II [Colletotrichum siamense]
MPATTRSRGPSNSGAATRKNQQSQKPSRGKPQSTTASNNAKRVPRSRTFTGCRTCRSRHLKCDEARPICSSCRRLNLVCEGYDGQLLWVPDPLCSASGDQKHASSSHRGTSYRYPLFTEDERNSMAVEIVESMGDRSAGDIVLDLDEKSVHGVDEVCLDGPFGVFRAFEGDSITNSDTSSSPLLQQSESSPTSSPAEALPDLVGGELLDDDVEEVVIEPWSVHDDHIAIEPSFLPGHFDAFGTDAMMNLGQPWMHDQQQQDTDHVQENTNNATSPPSDMNLPIPRKVSTPFTNNLPGVTPCLPTHAASLLRYYKSIDSSSSVKGMRISPWQLWLLPCALETFAELSLWNTTTHTRHSILCTLLARSAFHLHRSLKTDEKAASQWLEVGLDYQKSAQSHLKMALQSESDETSQAKYNEILMAILATAMVSVLYNGSRAVKIFLLDAERLIRLRGLSMPRSFNIRVLHHVYTHLRVIAESTDISSDNAPKTGQALSAQAQAQAATEMAVSLRKFRIAEDSLGADLDISREKPAEVGYADIHLDISGHWPVTMYPDIYGVPESLMTLLSQTISFANEKAKLEAIALYDPRVSAGLSRHVKMLEQHIWSWSLDSSDNQSGPSRPRELMNRDARLVDHPIIKSLTLAMHQALIIYFYRRVYNMSAMVIQDAVRKTLDYIQPCLEETADDHDFATSIGWAGFIAACEATTPDLQERGKLILESIDAQGVIFGADKPSVLAQSLREQLHLLGILHHLIVISGMASDSDCSPAQLLEHARTDVRLPVAEPFLSAVLTRPPFINVTGTFNTRDVGLVPGSPIRKGYVFRSGALENLDNVGKQQIAGQLGIKRIFDLRTRHEREKYPEPDVPGCDIMWIPNSFNNTVDINDFVSGGGEEGYCKMYMDIMEIYAPTLKIVLEHVRDRPQEPFLFHCALGRDRTGILAGFLLSLAGANAETIALDYMLSRIGSEPVRELLLQRAVEDNNCDFDVPVFHNLCSLRLSTWQLFMTQVEAKYGGFEKYAMVTLGFSREEIKRIVGHLRA